MENNITLEGIKKTGIYDFIEDKDLKDELYLFLYYISYLHFGINENYHSCKNIIFSTKHTIIIYIGSVIEAILYYFVHKKLEGKKDRLEKYCKTHTYIESREKIKILKGKNEYFACEKIEKNQEFKGDINFNLLIKGVEKYKLLSKKSIEILNNIRQKRNSIHLTVLHNYKGSIGFDDLEQIFNDTGFIIEEISENLKNTTK